MTYDRFVMSILERVQKGVGDSVSVSVYTAVKNNGTKRKGLTLTEKGVNIAPTIYLEEFYQRFLRGMTEEKAAKEVIKLYDQVCAGRSWEKGKLEKYVSVRDHIIYRLIGKKTNMRLLEEIPHREFLDLAVVYYVLLEVNDFGTAAMMIKKEHMKLWKVTEDELYRRAGENTRRILPEEFCTMHTVIQDMFDLEPREASVNSEEGEFAETLYVLTNRLRSHGASALLYEGCLEQIAKKLFCNYFVLPSSIHEVIITPDRHQFSYEELSAMVKEINETQVEAEEVLSDHAYYYDRTRGELTYF